MSLRRNARDKPVVIMRFMNRKHKNVLPKPGKKTEKEHLAKHNTDIAEKHLKKLTKTVKLSSKSKDQQRRHKCC